MSTTKTICLTTAAILALGGAVMHEFHDIPVFQGEYQFKK